MTEICPVTGKEVPSCSCGPHLECPEHLLNCLMDPDLPDDHPAVLEAFGDGDDE